MTESRQQYIERMAAIAAKMNWSSGDFEWLNNHLGKNDLVVEIEKSAQHHAHLTQAGGGNQADELQPPAQVA